MCKDDMNNSIREVRASAGQKLLWFLEHYSPESAVLNCPLCFRARGPFDLFALARAFNILTVRHEALRTTFVGRGRDLCQRVHAPAPLAVRYIDCSAMPDPESFVEQALVEELNARIDAGVWPARLTVWALNENNHVVCLNIHHLVADASSGVLLIRDLCTLLATANPAPDALPPVKWQFSDFREWQQGLLESDSTHPHREYWMRKLAGIGLPSIPLQPNSAGSRVFHSASHSITLAQRSMQGLNLAARTHRTTQFSLMLAIFLMALHLETGQTDLAVCALFANRVKPETTNTVGFLANMVVLRTAFADAVSFGDLVRAAHVTVQEAMKFQALPYQVLPTSLFPAGPRRVDDVVFQMLPMPAQMWKVSELEIEMFASQHVPSRFLLELTMVPSPQELTAILFYNSARLESAWARRLLERYAALIELIAAQPDPRLEDIRAGFPR